MTALITGQLYTKRCCQIRPENYFLSIPVHALHKSARFSAKNFIQEEKVIKVASLSAGMA